MPAARFIQLVSATCALGSALALTSLAAAAAPEVPADRGADAAPMPRLGSHQSHWQASLGARGAFITDRGYDPFSEDNYFSQISIGAGRTLFVQDYFSVAAMAFWDYGAPQSTARGAPTYLDVHRVSLGPELRLHLFPVLYVFARPSAAVLRTSASMDESVSGRRLYARSWAAGFDATVGTAFQFVGSKRAESHIPRFWLVAEGGYGWSSSTELKLSPDDDDESAPQRTQPVDLGDLALRGPMFRASVAATF